MNHMPYEDTRMTAAQEDQESKREAGNKEMPGRTPRSAEGPEKERKMPAGEPGKTPGSAEGEDYDVSEPPRH